MRCFIFCVPFVPHRVPAVTSCGSRFRGRPVPGPHAGLCPVAVDRYRTQQAHRLLRLLLAFAVRPLLRDLIVGERLHVIAHRRGHAHLELVFTRLQGPR